MFLLIPLFNVHNSYLPKSQLSTELIVSSILNRLLNQAAWSGPFHTCPSEMGEDMLL